MAVGKITREESIEGYGKQRKKFVKSSFLSVDRGKEVIQGYHLTKFTTPGGFFDFSTE